jgi:ribose-phosphate pyrophosphokinase
MTSVESSPAARTLSDEMGVVQTQSANTVLRREYDKRLMLVSGRANPVLAGRIADKLGVELSDANLKTFANGEVYCRYEESVRGADVFIVQPTCGNAAEGLTPNDALMELLEMVDAAVGGSAHRVIAVTPWYGYSRQDKKVGAAGADQRPSRRPHARVGGDRPPAHDGPALRADPGLLPEAV